VPNHSVQNRGAIGVLLIDVDERALYQPPQPSQGVSRPTLVLLPLLHFLLLFLFVKKLVALLLFLLLLL